MYAIYIYNDIEKRSEAVSAIYYAPYCRIQDLYPYYNIAANTRDVLTYMWDPSRQTKKDDRIALRKGKNII